MPVGLQKKMSDEGEAVARSQRWLAVAHTACGLALLLGSTWAGAVVLGVVPASTGFRMLVVLNAGFAFLGPALTFVPQSALGIWMLALARWLWNGHEGLRSALLVTHGLLLLVGSFFVLVGFHALAATERSTAEGGGLLSPLAFLPFLYALPIVILALWSIVIAFASIPRHRPAVR